MARIFITGSSDGLGLLTGRMLLEDGHHVVFHARNKKRADDIMQQFRGETKVLTADLSSMEETKELARDVNALGSFDAIIHNAGVYQEHAPVIFKVNILAPYILTALINKPERLVYISSGMHTGGSLDITNLSIEKGVDYSTSKLQVLMLSLAMSRRWPDVYVNAVDPGWVPTKMGGSRAPDNLYDGVRTQVWLASAKDARISGKYFFHLKVMRHSSKADDESAQEMLLKSLEEITGVGLPADR